MWKKRKGKKRGKKTISFQQLTRISPCWPLLPWELRPGDEGPTGSSHLRQKMAQTMPPQARESQHLSGSDPSKSGTRCGHEWTLLPWKCESRIRYLRGGGCGGLHDHLHNSLRACRQIGGKQLEHLVETRLEVLPIRLLQLTAASLPVLAEPSTEMVPGMRKA